MKKGIPISILSIILLLCLVFFFLQRQEIRRLRVEKDAFQQKNRRLLDEKLGEYQFQVEYLFAVEDFEEAFFDSLICSLKLMRNLLARKVLLPSDQEYLTRFIEKNLPATAYLNLADYLEQHDYENTNALFEGDDITIVERLLPLINPFHFTKCIYTEDYDVWIDRETADTLYYRVRLLKNHELRSTFLEILPGKRVKLLNANLAEIAIPKSEPSPRKLSFDLVDWMKKDTVCVEGVVW